MILGMIMLGLQGLADIFGITMAAAAAAVAGVILIIAGIALVIAGIIMIVKNWGKDWAKVVKGIAIVLAGLALIIIGIAILIGSWPLAFVAAGILIVAAILWLVSKVIKHWDKIKEVSWNALKAIGGWFKKWFWDKPKEWLSALLDWVKNMWGKITSVFHRGSKTASSKVGMPSRQSGGIIPENGPYYLHKGEYVVPPSRARSGSGESNISVNTTYNVQVSDKVEMEKMLRENNGKLVEDVKRQIAVK